MTTSDKNITRNFDWPYDDSYDEVVAAPRSHIVRYEDDHIRLVEVAIAPGAKTEMHGSPYPAVLAYDAAQPEVTETWLEPGGKMHGEGAGFALPPLGMDYPHSKTMAPLAPRSIQNNDSFPFHFYRIEFKRLDGDDFPKKWKELYPFMEEPLNIKPNMDPRDTATHGPIISEVYPFVLASESYNAAPNNHWVRYEDEHVVFIEVIYRFGERGNLHGHSQPSVFAHDVDLGLPKNINGRMPTPDKFIQPPDNTPGFTPGDPQGLVGDWKLVPEGINGQDGGLAAPPEGWSQPTSWTMGPQWPHSATGNFDAPIHFFRLQYKRIDGEDIKTHWREWYPWIEG